MMMIMMMITCAVKVTASQFSLPLGAKKQKKIKKLKTKTDIAQKIGLGNSPSR